MRSFAFFLVLTSASLVCACGETLPSLDEAVKSRADVYGEAAMREKNGASYEFFEKLLPPVRYVNADFRYYPIVLSAPNAKVKARLISNGSSLNPRAGSGLWSDNGTPAFFRVGPDQFLFGTFADRLQAEPVLAEGFLPIIELRYLHQTPMQAEGMVPLDQQRIDRPSEIYKLEAFASTDPALANNGVVFVRFSLVQGVLGILTVQLDSRGPLKFEDGKVLDKKGGVLAWFDERWKWENQRVQARFTNGVITCAIATKALTNAGITFDEKSFSNQRERCAADWRSALSAGMNVETPEPVVNNAWRHLMIQNFELINGDRIHYSQGNQYDKLYESEGSDAALAFLVWGYEKDMRRLIVPLLDFTRKGLEFHQAGFKLNDVCRYYWQTRDAASVRELRSWSKPKNYRTSEKESRSGWEIEAKRLDESRTGAHGLFPMEQYCGDIHTPVQTLNANAKAWRAFRDLSAVLSEIGETQQAEHYASVAKNFRQTVLEAIERSAVRSIDPPFVPVALYTNEPAHDPICDVRIGSYWNIIIGYTIGSGIFPPGSPEENWIPKYQEQHGGLFMGMLRSGGMSNTWWNTEYKLNPLYGTRYALDTLRRDDVERSLVCFYGMLAQGFTRNTFICGEGASVVPTDLRGRLVSLPPNSAANAHFLSMLRYMLVQDWDLDDDGKPETLRLMFGTPKRWLEDGKAIKVTGAPTAFGPVSIDMRSEIGSGKVLAAVDLPQRNEPKHILLRARVPDGFTVAAASTGAKKLDVDKAGTVDLTGLKGRVEVAFTVK
jgi:hypothetical protein